MPRCSWKECVNPLKWTSAVISGLQSSKLISGLYELKSQMNWVACLVLVRLRGWMDRPNVIQA
jgi:hypothetical protein